MNTEPVFLNSDYLVIEYTDLIKSPYLMLLHQIRRNDKVRDLLKIEQIEFLDDIALYEWYINRKHQNFLIDLCRYPEVTEEQLNDLLEDQINLSSKFYELSEPLVLTDTIKILLSKPYTKNGIIIYHPHKNDFVSKDLENIFNKRFTVMDDFNEVIKKTKENSTYFLSDIDKINILDDAGYLKYSSVILPIEYRYNKKNMNDFKIDFQEKIKKSCFKLSLFRACTFIEEDDNEKKGI